eukprot:TRINITY_DN969_c0_g3_i1.p1 TRINITY_DN969_c0_g3~~TRINITY_DN969_c0_g3_i1.p1  ORF type:complete len:866 (-),score=253.14 TRINITY_DN969_c0_g3_i1:81-2606(-)
MAPKAEETKKRKAEDAPAEEPAAKKEIQKDVESDAGVDPRPVTKVTVGWNGADTTLNTIPAMQGKVLMAMTEGGMQYLIAGARASLGMKAGRYMYEVRIIEALNPSESTQGAGGRSPAPRQLVRLGFSAAGSALVLGDSEDSAYFDSEGNFNAGKVKRKFAQNFTRDQVIGVLLNLDPESPNAYTMSLFRDGVRIAQPQKIPESLQGKVLFPHICFRNVTVQVNMGPTLLKELPFKCRTMKGAAAADVVENRVVPKGGKYDVILPVGMPDEGTFAWLDTFLEANPTYVELSDRKLQEWAASSGLKTPKGTSGSSNDKPVFNYNLPSMDDMSLQKVVNSVAPAVPRNYVVMEVKGNLVAEERAEVLKRFSLSKFKKIATVMMGEPSEEFKEQVQEKILKEKQAKADNEWKVKKAQKAQQKALAKRQKEMAEKKKKQEEQRKKQVEEALKKKAEAEVKKAEVLEVGEVKKEEDDSKKEGETKEEEKSEVKEEGKEEEKTEVKEEEVKEEPEEEDDGLGDEPPKAELTEEEKTRYFKPKVGSGDLTASALAKHFANFSIPDQLEGFDEVRFEWEDEDKSKAYLRKWMLETKAVARIEDLEPSKYFVDKNSTWQKQFSDWQSKQKAFKAKPAGKKKDENSEEARASVDLFSVEDVNDMGHGEPLYSNFCPEDWALLQLRMELHLLQECYKKDVDDPDRVEVPENHLAFYYHKYFKKSLHPQSFNLKTNTELLLLVKDTATIAGEPPALTSHLEDTESPDIFVKFTEECRRDRKRRCDAGDETVRLKYTPASVQSTAPGISAKPSMPAPRPKVQGPSPPAMPAVPGFKASGKGSGGMMGSWKGKGW